MSPEFPTKFAPFAAFQIWYVTCVHSVRAASSIMTITSPSIIRCPVCQSSGAMLHHDIRAPLVYSCMKCLHEWQIELAEEPPREDLAAVERRRTPSARVRRPRKR